MRKISKKIGKIFEKRALLALCSLILVGFFIFPHNTHAWEFWDTLKGLAANPVQAMITIVVNTLLEFVAFFTGLTAVILNKTIEYTVVNMNANVSAITGITIAWGVIRDLINMSFIFILLYIAIGTILDIGVNWKSTLIKVIIAAILINFSLFFTRIVIDASNILALTFYHQMVSPAQIAAGQGLADSFAGPLKIASFYNNPQSNQVTAGGIIVVGLLGSLFLAVTAFVFLAASLLFLSRFVTLIFLLILSPIGFFGSVLPGLGSAAKKWRDTLIGQAIFAPIYMILTWVVLVIINDPGFLAKKAGIGDLGGTLTRAQGATQTGAQFAQNLGAFEVFINFIIIIVFMIATLIISKSAASQGVNLGQKLVGSATGVVVGAGGWAGRKSLGRMGKSVADSDYLKSKAPNSRMARLALQGGNKFAKGSYDFRESSFANMGKSMGVDMNLGIGGKSGGKGGYDAYLKDRIKKEKEIGESFKPSDIAIEEAKTRVSTAKSPEDKARAQEYLDGLQGVSKDEAKKRADALEKDKAEQIKRIDRTRAEEAQRKMKLAQEELAKKQEELKKATLGGTVQPLPQDKAALEAIEREKEEAARELTEAEAETKKREVEIAAEIDRQKARTATERNDAGKERAIKYAEGIAPEGNFGLSTKRVLFVGPVQKQYRQAAIELRKGGKKPMADRLKDLMIENGDIPPEKPKEETPPEAPKP